MGDIFGILLFIAGLVGILPVDTRLAWGLVMIAGLLVFL